MYSPRVCSRDSSFFLKGCNWYFISMWSFYNNPFVIRAYFLLPWQPILINRGQQNHWIALCSLRRITCPLVLCQSSSSGPVTLLAHWSEHASVQGNPLLTQEQCLVRQVPWQPQQTNSITASGAGARTVHTISSWPSLSCQPWFSGPMSGDWGSRAHFQIYAW